MRRAFWTFGLAAMGFFLGWTGQGVNLDLGKVLIATIWAGSIGYGFGSIFDQRRPGLALIVYWAVTLALLGTFFGPLLPVASFIIRQVLGAAIGTLVGVLLGVVHLKVAQRRLRLAGDSSSASGQ
jgi:hypothetical protein